MSTENLIHRSKYEKKNNVSIICIFVCYVIFKAEKILNDMQKWILAIKQVFV